MSKKDVVRAWKDAEYRNSLTAEELAALPENPAGATELPDAELENAAGGAVPWTIPLTIGLTVSVCSPGGTGCGTCNWGTRGCC